MNAHFNVIGLEKLLEKLEQTGVFIQKVQCVTTYKVMRYNETGETGVFLGGNAYEKIKNIYVYIGTIAKKVQFLQCVL